MENKTFNESLLLSKIGGEGHIHGGNVSEKKLTKILKEIGTNIEKLNVGKLYFFLCPSFILN